MDKAGDNRNGWLEYDTEGRLAAVMDAENRRVEYTYGNGLLSSVTDILGNVTEYEYDNDGRIIKVTYPDGSISNVAYDDYGNVYSVLDNNGNGHWFDFDYDQATKVSYAMVESSSGMVKEVWFDSDFDTKKIDINGNTVKKIEKDGRNLIITDENGNVTYKDFDEWNNLTKVTYPDGSTVSYEYEHTYNRKIKETNELGVVTEYEYDASGNMTSRTEAVGTGDERTTEYTYDANGNQLTVTTLATATALEAGSSMTYDASGNMTSITDPEGNVTQFTSFDSMGNVLTKVDADNKTWTYAYDDMGRLVSATDPLNNVTSFEYDAVGNKVKQTDAEGKVTLYAYDYHGNLIQTTDATGAVTRFEYNSDNKLVKQTDAEGKVTEYEYDNQGRLITTIDGNGNEISMEYDDSTGSGCTTCASGGGSSQVARIVYPTFTKEFTYDKRGRKTEERDVLSETETYATAYEYDEAGNLISKTDKEGKVTQYEYDNLNRLKKVIDPLNQETTYTYDSRDNLLSLTDAEGNVTTFEYDKNNRLVKETRPMAEATNYEYDTLGNLITKTDAKGQKTEYNYDVRGQMSEVRYFATTDLVNPVKEVDFTYDDVGNLMTYDDGTTTGAYVYDSAYRKVSETIDYGDFEKTFSYSYLNNGLKASFTGSDGITYSYAYDANNQLTSVQIPGQGSITYNTYQWNRPTNITLPGGTAKTYTYDPLMRVTAITSDDPGQNILLNYQYTYDKMDNILTKTTEDDDYVYEYDDLYRLIGSTAASANEAFTYDGVGNRITSAETTGDWDYNQNNELQSYGDMTFEYDLNGNLTSKIDSSNPSNSSNYTYDIENRLIEISNSESQISNYYYDPFGRRLWKEVGGTTTYFMYADEGLVAELDDTGAETKTYGYVPNSTWTTDPLFMEENNTYYFYHNDHLGTPQKITSVNGAVVWSAKYSAFGEAEIDATSTVTNNLRFPGQYYDQETGLHYNWNRYYDPTIGRYLSSDPLGQYGGVNLFTYTENNPINYIDPLGLHSIVVCTDTNQVEIFDDDGKSVYKERSVTGCPGHDTPEGTFQAGDWVTDKTNPKYGPTPWSKDITNPYGPYFLPIYNQKGQYTGYGIHGTAGPGWSPFVKPPFAKWWSDQDDYLYCSHGCVRQSNPDITKMHDDILPNPKGTPIIIKKCK